MYSICVQFMLTDSCIQILLGTYSSTITPGEFIWLPGVLTQVIISSMNFFSTCIINARSGALAPIPFILQSRKGCSVEKYTFINFLLLCMLAYSQE